MNIQGRVQNGVVVLPDGVSLPEGAAVTVSCPVEAAGIQSAPERRRIQIPLVKTGAMGRVNLMNERIAEILDEEDIARYFATCG